MSEDLVWDKAKGELRILGQRHTALDAQALCNHLDSLVGVQVSEVIMKSLEFRLGKEDAARIRQERPRATISEVVDFLRETDQLSGVGITEVAFSGNQGPVVVEISNPSVKGTVGAARAFLFSWWCGALTTLLDTDLDLKGVDYDEERDVMKCRIVPRTAK